MTCERCRSEKQNVFSGEVAIHFPGRKGLEKPIVWAFPKLVVCLQCGFTEFTVPERELQVLEQGFPVEGAVVLWPRGHRRQEESGEVKIESPLSEMN